MFYKRLIDDEWVIQVIYLRTKLKLINIKLFKLIKNHFSCSKEKSIDRVLNKCFILVFNTVESIIAFYDYNIHTNINKQCKQTTEKKLVTQYE